MLRIFADLKLIPAPGTSRERRLKNAIVPRGKANTNETTGPEKFLALIDWFVELTTAAFGLKLYLRDHRVKLVDLFEKSVHIFGATPRDLITSALQIVKARAPTDAPNFHGWRVWLMVVACFME